MANSERKLIFPIFLEDVDLSANELTRGVKFIISGVNWTMFRSGVEDYNNSLEKLIQGLNEKGEVVEFDKSVGIEKIQTNRLRRVWSVAMNYVYCAINFHRFLCFKICYEHFVFSFVMQAFDVGLMQLMLEIFLIRVN